MDSTEILAPSEVRAPAASVPRRIFAVRYVWGSILLLALSIPWFTNEYTQYVVNLMLVYVLVTVGFNLVIGHLGQLAFCNVAFFGIGAYATAIPMDRFGLPFWLALLPCAAAGALAGVLASFPALRGIRALRADHHDTVAVAELAVLDAAGLALDLEPQLEVEGFAQPVDHACRVAAVERRRDARPAGWGGFHADSLPKQCAAMMSMVDIVVNH